MLIVKSSLEADIFGGACWAAQISLKYQQQLWNGWLKQNLDICAKTSMLLQKNGRSVFFFKRGWSTVCIFVANFLKTSWAKKEFRNIIRKLITIPTIFFFPETICDFFVCQNLNVNTKQPFLLLLLSVKSHNFK